MTIIYTTMFIIYTTTTITHLHHIIHQEWLWSGNWELTSPSPSEVQIWSSYPLSHSLYPLLPQSHSITILSIKNYYDLETENWHHHHHLRSKYDHNFHYHIHCIHNCHNHTPSPPLPPYHLFSNIHTSFSTTNYENQWKDKNRDGLNLLWPQGPSETYLFSYNHMRLLIPKHIIFLILSYVLLQY